MIIKVDENGKKLEGKLNPSSEIKMHMRVYRERPDVMAVVHAHPPVATAFTVADIDLDQYILPEAVLTIGNVPTCDYGTPSTMEIPDSLDPYLQNHDAFLLRNHGALTVGCNLTKAFFIMEEVEFNAIICKHAMDLGAVHEISNEQLKKLMDLRKRMNLPGRHPGIDYGEETNTSCACNQEELVAEITRRVLAALGK
jgi:L-fuculose-phosphate aldolase